MAQEYLRSKFYLLSADEKLVIPQPHFKSATEAFNYAVEHDLSRRGYTGVRGVSVIRMLAKKLISEHTFPWPKGLPQIVRSTIPEPLATVIRRELRKLPAWKLKEVYDNLRKSKPTGIDIVEKHRSDAINAVREILWERGKLPRGELKMVPQVLGSKFPLGQLVMTRGVADKVATDAAFAAFALESLKRHANGDWGDLCEEDKRENEYALGKHLRLFSAYDKYPFPKIWIITEADRSVTTTLLPEEY